MRLSNKMINFRCDIPAAIVVPRIELTAATLEGQSMGKVRASIVLMFSKPQLVHIKRIRVMEGKNRWTL